MGSGCSGPSAASPCQQHFCARQVGTFSSWAARKRHRNYWGVHDEDGLSFLHCFSSDRRFRRDERQPRHPGVQLTYGRILGKRWVYFLSVLLSTLEVLYCCSVYLICAWAAGALQSGGAASSLPYCVAPLVVKKKKKMQRSLKLHSLSKSVFLSRSSCNRKSTQSLSFHPLL